MIPSVTVITKQQLVLRQKNTTSISKSGNWHTLNSSYSVRRTFLGPKLQVLLIGSRLKGVKKDTGTNSWCPKSGTQGYCHLLYVGHIGMCFYVGYGIKPFSLNQRVWVKKTWVSYTIKIRKCRHLHHCPKFHREYRTCTRCTAIYIF